MVSEFTSDNANCGQADGSLSPEIIPAHGFLRKPVVFHCISENASQKVNAVAVQKTAMKKGVPGGTPFSIYHYIYGSLQNNDLLVCYRKSDDLGISLLNVECIICVYIAVQVYVAACNSLISQGVLVLVY